MKRHRISSFMILLFALLSVVVIVSLLTDSYQVQSLYRDESIHSDKSVHSDKNKIVNNSSTGEGKVLDVPFIAQGKRYPTGCESTTAVMALRYVNIEMSVDEFIDEYLELGTAPYEYNGELYGDSPWDCFLGSPYEETGWGCYSPVIKRALTKVLRGGHYTTEAPLNKTLEELCTEYIDNDIPVILWATMEMRKAFTTSSWYTPNGDRFTWIAPEHCLLLVGYDEDYYYFNDSRQSQQTAYKKREVENAYKSMLSQAVVIVPKD